MLLYVGLDDTDNHDSRGTGRLARTIAETLAADFRLLGVTRHQLLVDPRVPYTSHNSSACVLLEADTPPDLAALFARVRALMLADFQPGSDPGLCVAAAGIPPEVQRFGARAKTEVVDQAEARQLAGRLNLLLAGLGGTEGGVIGALAAVGLGAGGEDGRYLLVGRTRELSGLQPVEAVLAAGIHEIRTAEGQPVTAGPVLADKLRPARRASRPVQFVAWQEDRWLPLKLD